MSYEGNEATIKNATKQSENLLTYSANNLVIPGYIFDENNSNKLIYKITKIGSQCFSEYTVNGAKLRGSLSIPNTVKEIA